MSDIPRARKELLDLAARLPSWANAEIKDIIVHCLYRESPVRKARVKNRGVTAQMKNTIFNLYRQFPDMHQDEIARRAGTNAGRVSEVLHGKR